MNVRKQLIRDLCDPEPDERFVRVVCLIEEGGDKALESLAEDLSADDDYVRAAAAWGLGRLRDDRATEVLCSALNDENLDVQEVICATLDYIGAREAVPALLLLSHSDSAVNRVRAATTLGWQLAGTSREVRERLEQLLRDEESSVRAAAIGSLGGIHHPQIVELAQRATRDPDTEVRVTALEVLGDSRAPEAFDIIAAFLSDPTPRVRGIAARALAACDDTRAIKYLHPMLKDINAQVRSIASECLFARLSR